MEDVDNDKEGKRKGRKSPGSGCKPRSFPNDSDHDSDDDDNQDDDNQNNDSVNVSNVFVVEEATEKNR